MHFMEEDPPVVRHDADFVASSQTETSVPDTRSLAFYARLE